MSSILRALKKVEQEAASGRQPAGEKPEAAAVGGEAPPKRASRRFRTVGTLILAAAILVFSGVYFSRAPQEPSVAVVDAEPEKSAEKPVETPGGPAPRPKEPDPGLSGKPAEVPAVPAPAAASAPETAVDPPPAPVMPATAQEQLPPPTILPEADATTVLDDRTVPPPAPQSSPPPPQTSKPAPEAPPASRPALTLEGIVWSDAPQDRMAIINGKMVHEGDVIEGVRIRSIREDDVEVSANGERWTVRF